MIVAIWYFDGELTHSNPQHVYTGASYDAAFEALCNRFGPHRFEMESELDAMRKGSYCIELPGGSNCAVIINKERC